MTKNDKANMEDVGTGDLGPTDRLSSHVTIPIALIPKIRIVSEWNAA